jgi:hypothetical protein
MKRSITNLNIMIISKQVIKITAITAFLALLFISCKKQTLTPAVQNKMSDVVNGKPDSSSPTDVVQNTTYYCCGIKVNVFTPLEHSANTYSFAYTVNGQQNRFGITKAGQINFTNPDKFSFEYAGYLDASGTVKSWRIRRTDGKYLTTILGNGLTYADKLLGSHEVEQIFLLSSLGNNVYNIVLPKLSICNKVAIWYDIDLGDRIASFNYDSRMLTGKDTKITMVKNSLVNN